MINNRLKKLSIQLLEYSLKIKEGESISNNLEKMEYH